MSQENLEVVRQSVEAWQRDDFESWLLTSRSSPFPAASRSGHRSRSAQSARSPSTR